MRGLRSTLAEVRQHLLNNDYDVYVFTETWLCSGIYDSEMFDDNYRVYRRDRESSSHSNYKKMGGGVLIAVSNRFNSIRMHEWESNLEDLWIKIAFGSNDNRNYLKLCGVYLPPPVQSDIFEGFLENCCSVIHKNSESPTLLVGDFNLRSIDWIDNDTNQCLVPSPVSSGSLKNALFDFMSLHNLNQYNSVRNSQNKILDLLISDCEQINVNNCCTPIRAIDKFHPAIEFCLVLPKSIKNKFSHIKKLSYHKGDYEAIISCLNKVDWNTEFLTCVDVNCAVEKFYTIIKEVITNHVPEISYCKGKYPPWYSNYLKKTLKRKLTIRNKVKKYNNPLDLIEFKYLKNECKLLMRCCYNQYIEDIENRIKTHPKFFWTHIKSLRKDKNSYPSEMFLGSKIAKDTKGVSNLFAEQFSSVFDMVGTNHDVRVDHISPVINDISNFSISPEAVVKSYRGSTFQKV